MRTFEVSGAKNIKNEKPSVLSGTDSNWTISERTGHNAIDFVTFIKQICTTVG